MKTTHLLLSTALLAAMVAGTRAGLLDGIFPKAIKDFYNSAPSQEGYGFSIEESNGSKREEKGIILNPGTDKEELVVMGTYSTVDEKTDIETVTMYTADKNGYRPRYEIRNRKLSAGSLKAVSG